ncbi:phage tail tube protein [Carnobacterium pleistocenium]|uniref:phage tail tube protein n=1 Tax=Carnobacterium pleistocenium TaxID=181073 RepID=UPI0005579EAF|nr:hypothetical protein [Carnobacterium pleistocenium]
MARTKNALRKHEIAPRTDETIPTDGYLELGKYISSITDDTEEEKDEEVYYDGDGTPSNEVISLAEAWTVEGTYDPEDAGQKLVADMKRKLGTNRNVWHRITYPSGIIVEGPATVNDIIAGGGDAADYDAFSCVLNYSRIPTVTPATTT